METIVALPAAASLPAVLPISSVGALGIEDIVGDLEGGAEIPAEGRDIVTLLRLRAAEDRPGLRAVLDEAPGFQCLESGDLGRGEVRPFRQHVDHLAADHAARAGGGAERRHKLAPGLGIGMGIAVDQHLEGAGEQRVARPGSPSPRQRRLWQEGWPRRRSSSSIAGRSSCTSE